MKPYPTYKDSGIEWLGKIPKNWSVIKLAYFVDKLTNGYVGPTRDILRDEGVRYIQSLHVKQNTIKFHKPYFVSEEWSNQHSRSILREDDILVVQTGAIGEVAIVPQEFEGANCHALIILSPDKTRSFAKFLLYLLTSHYGFHSIQNIQTGALHPHLNATKLRDVVTPLPPLTEQRAIADYLDRKTGQIDTLIEKKQRQIELLKEQRTALINQAVTKGLNPDAPMKDSGIEWLGEVPEHWAMVKLSYVANVFNGTTPSRSRLDYWENGVIPWLSSGKVNDYIVKSPSELITEAAFQETSLSMVPKGSVIMGMIGQGKTRGMSAFLEIEACINQNLAAIVPNEKLYGKYLHHFLVTAYKPIREDGRGANQEALNCQIVAAFRIPLPPKNEQFEIADFLERNIAQVDGFIDETNKTIELLQEYRTALISEAVTGKIDVRGEG